MSTLLVSLVTHMSEHLAHISVMPKEVDEYLNLSSGDTAVDGTLGLAGHAVEMAKRIGDKGHLIGIDQDTQVISLARERLNDFSGKLDIVKSNFRHLRDVLDACGVKQINGLLLDLGVSSIQLDSPERGFSFQKDGPLDMRMDQEVFTSAFELVNSLSERELETILRDYGQERWAKRIARGIVWNREKATIKTTEQLKEIIFKSVPGQFRRQRIHPATRSFQAIRIAVNRELEALETVLDDALSCLAPQGRLVVIAFHSLEDRIVKHRFRQWAKDGQVELLIKKPLIATDEECEHNPRARSAKLRAVEKIES